MPANVAVRRSAARDGRRVGLALWPSCVVGMARHQHVRTMQQKRRHMCGLPQLVALLLLVRWLVGTVTKTKGLAYCEAKCARVLRAQCNETQAYLARVLRAPMKHTRIAVAAQQFQRSRACIVIQALSGSRYVASPHVVGSEIEHNTELGIPQPLSMNLSVLLLK